MRGEEERNKIKTSSAETAIKRFPFDLMMAMTIKQGKRGTIPTLNAYYSRLSYRL